MIKSSKRIDRATASELLSVRLLRSHIVGAEKREHEWLFRFSTGLLLQVWGLWRILASGALALTSEDDGQKFGLSTPVDAKTRAMTLFGSKPIAAFAIREFSADLSFTFDSGEQLEILSTSAGYESWMIVDSGVDIVGQGGGQIAMYE